MSVSEPPPCIRDASTNSTSPPAGVQASPTATPGSLVRFSISSSRNDGAPSMLTIVSGVIDDLGLVPFRAAPRDLPAQRADLALEIAHAGLARVAADDVANRGLRELDLLGRQPVILHLLPDQVLEGDLQLLFLGVAGELEDLHAVAQRRRDRIEDVGRRHEQDLGQVERHVEIVIAERVVLLGVEHFEQRRRRVAAEVRARACRSRRG